jgi:hypothetical protein
MDRSIVGALLPNVTRLKITNVKGLSPLTLAIWLLLAPNVGMLEIEYMTFSETMEWGLELSDALAMSNQRLKMIFQRIQRINISYACHNYTLRLKLPLHSTVAEIFSIATIE